MTTASSGKGDDAVATADSTSAATVLQAPERELDIRDQLHSREPEASNEELGSKEQKECSSTDSEHNLELEKDVSNGEITMNNSPNGLHCNVPEVIDVQLKPTPGGDDDDNPKKDVPIAQRKVSQGYMRHVVAVLALSSIVLANMNRQAFNQALVSMTRHHKHNDSTTDVPSTPASLLTYTTTIQDLETTTRQYETTTSFLIDSTSIYPEATTSVWQETNKTTFEAMSALPETTPASFSQEESSVTFIDPNEDVFDWSSDQIALLQAAFSLGYTPFMIPGGRMSEVYGAKWVVFLSGFGSAICCLLSPFLSDTNFYLLAASRVVMGLSQTGVSPALYALLVRWLPPTESNVYLPMIKVGVVVGFMSGSLVSGFTVSWRHTFYLVGSIGMLWSIMWAIVVSSDPKDNRYVSRRELDFVQREIRLANKNSKQMTDANRGNSAPWGRIFLNPVVLAFTATKFTVKLSTDAQTMQIPMYLRNIFHVSKKLNSVLSAMNFAIQGTLTGIVAYTAKEMVVRKSFGLSKTGVRRLFQSTCNFGMAIAFIMMTLNMSQLWIVVAAIVLLSLAAMFGAGGEAVTPVDLSLEYSATIMAIANSGANFSGLILPTIVAKVLGEQKNSPLRWNMVWWIVAGIMTAGGLAYTCLVTAELQDFRSKSKKQDVEKGDVELHDEAIEMKSDIKR